MTRRTVLLCWLALAILWFAPLDYRLIVHPDEGRYSEISREMLVTGDWVTPRLDGLKYFEKPPLQYWASAASFAVFGVNEFAARFYVALCGFLTVLITAFTARRLWGDAAGAYAAIVTAGTTWVMALAHVVTLDMGLSFFLTVTLCAFLLAQNERAAEGERRKWMWLVWAGMAGATLSKGLVGGVIPGGVLVLYSLICRQWQIWKRMEWVPGVAIFLVIAAPWFVLVSIRNPEFPEFFFIHEHFARYLESGHNRGGAPWYFVPLVLGGLMPWTTLAPAFLRYGWSRSGEAQTLNRLLLIWCAFIFLFFSASSSKLPGYILPMFPALALVLAQYFVQAQPRILKPHAMAFVIFWTVIAIAAPFVVPNLSTRSTPREINLALGPWLIAAGVTYALFAVGAMRAAGAGRKMLSVLILGAGSVVVLQICNAGYQVFTPLKSAYNIANDARPSIRPETELFVIKAYDQTLPFYLQRTLTTVEFSEELSLGQAQEPEKSIATIDAFRERWLAAKDAVAFTSPGTLKDLQASGLPMEVINVRYRHAAFRKPAAP